MSETAIEFCHDDVFTAVGDLPTDYASCAIIDYPWEFDYENGAGRYGYDRDSEANPLFNMEAEERIGELFDLLNRVVVDGGWILCFADDEFQDVVRTQLRENQQMIFRRNWAWTHNRLGMGYYGRVSHYPIPVATNGETDRYVQGRKTLFSVDGRAEADYSTAKPVPLVRQLLEPPVLREGERVLEPFCGTAPAAVVASERDVGYWGCDVDSDVLATAKSRLP